MHSLQLGMRHAFIAAGSQACIHCNCSGQATGTEKIWQLSDFAIDATLGCRQGMNRPVCS